MSLLFTTLFLIENPDNYAKLPLCSILVAVDKKPLIIVGIGNKIQKDKLNEMGILDKMTQAK